MIYLFAHTVYHILMAISCSYVKLCEITRERERESALGSADLKHQTYQTLGSEGEILEALHFDPLWDPDPSKRFAMADSRVQNSWNFG